MVFIALEGFSGTGKTTLARGLERGGWLRLAESAHVVPREVPLADRADTCADYSLFGATLVYSSLIAGLRARRRIVSEGYLLSDLTYARIRHDLGRSEAYPTMLAVCRRTLSDPALQPDLYVLLRAAKETIRKRQRLKSLRERNVNEFFRRRYYAAIEELHRTLHQDNVVTVYTDSGTGAALASIRAILRNRRLAKG